MLEFKRTIGGYSMEEKLNLDLLFNHSNTKEDDYFPPCTILINPDRVQLGEFLYDGDGGVVVTQNKNYLNIPFKTQHI